MRSSVFRGVGRPLSVETTDDPRPRSGEVVLKVCRCGICGTDLHRTERNFATYREGVVPGHEFSGEVVELGAGVTGLKIGDLVTALPYIGCNQCAHCVNGYPAACEKMLNLGSDDIAGAYAQYVVTAAPFTLKLPGTLSAEDGALVEPLAVAVRAVRRAGVGPGARVLVMGAGPIGLAIAYWARRAGAGFVAVQASSRRREGFAAAMGADAFITPVQGQLPEETAVSVMGGAPDIVFECIGVPGAIDQAIGAVALSGMVMVVGLCMEHDQWRPLFGLKKEVDIRFSRVYDRREYEIAIDALAAGGVEPRSMITQTVGLDALPEAFEGLRARSDQCKVMLDPWA